MVSFKKKVLISLAILLVMGLSLGSIALGAVKGHTSFTILHLNDLHGYLQPFRPSGAKEDVGGIAYISAIIKEKDPKTTLLLIAGDVLHGTNLANLFEGKPVIDVFNEMRVVAMTVGNHEFNYGQEVLKARAKEAKFPFLGANVELEKGGRPPYLKPYVIKKIGGIKVAILGLVTQETPVLSHPKNVAGLKFDDPIATAKRYVPQLKKKAQVVICLTHLGYEEDRKLVQAVPGIDILVGGHSHTEVKEPEKIGESIIVQAFEQGKVLGELKVTYAAGKITAYSGRLIPIAPRMAEDKKVSDIVALAAAALDKKLAEVVAQAGVSLNGERAEVRTKETNLGNLIADIMREATGAEIAFANGGGIRASIPAGAITLKHVYTVLPFGNYFLSLELTGSEIKEALENGVSQYDKVAGRFLQVSGLSYTFDPNKPEGSRVVEILVAGKPIDPNKKYSVAVNDFIAAGGDGFTVLKGKKELFINMSQFDREVMAEYLKKKGTVSPQVEGRIKVIK